MAAFFQLPDRNPSSRESKEIFTNSQSMGIVTVSPKEKRHHPSENGGKIWVRKACFF
jgi:hypothetical protein